MTDNKQDTGGLTLLDLFRLEVEAQATILNEGLLAFNTQSQSSQTLDSLVRAAHSVKGAAQLIEVEAAVNLAHIMEDCFVTTQNQSIALGADQVNVLQQGIELLLNISQVKEEDLESWLSEHEQEIETTRNALTEVLTPGSVVSHVRTQALPVQENPTVEVGLQDNQESQPTSIPQPSPPIAVVEPPREAPPPVATNIQVPIAAEETSIIGDSSMLDLFRLEVDAQATILNDGLLALESQPQSGKALESLMRAAHSIKGAARIVAIDGAVNLAHVLEDCFVAAQAHTITLGADHVDVLLRGVDLLINISQVEDRELKSWLSQNKQEIETTRQEISDLLTPGSTPAPRRDAVIQPPQNSGSGTGEQVTNTTDTKNQTQADQVSQQQHNIVATSNSVEARSIVKPTSSNLEQAKEPTTPAASNSDRVVRVSADNLNRIMGLAGESLIEANWLQPFADSMILLKKRQLELSKILQDFQEAVTASHSQEGKEYLEAARNKERDCREMLSDRIDALELYARRTANLSDRLYGEVIASNMRPFTDGVQGFPRMLRDLARKLGKQIKFDILGKSTPVDRDILKKLEAPLTHILRNSIDHGLELPDERLAAGKPAEGTVRLEASHRGGMLSINISDDGRGIDYERLRQKVINKGLSTPEMGAQLSDSELLEFLFLPGFSTAKQVTEISGRGVGLDIAKSMAQEVGGNVRAFSEFGKGTSFNFQLPLTLSVVRTLLVEISGEPYAFPLARIEQIVMVNKEKISSVESRHYFTMDNKNIGLVAAYQVLELKTSSPKTEELPVIVISEQSDYYGLVVDAVLGEHDLVVRPLDSRLGKVQDINAAALMGDGSPILIVDVSDLVRSVNNLLNSRQLNRFDQDVASTVVESRKSILVVDDSITVREMERKLLENKGYKVDVAVDGMEGWHTVSNNHYDLVVSDIDMPRMNGFELVAKIKSHPQLNSIPVIIVSYKDREEDRLRGLEAGADYYLTKASFQDDTLVNAVLDLIGNG